jgi:thioredoxin-like negative regulator of GroEL
MKSPLLASLLLMNFYLDAASDKNQQAVAKKQKASKRILTKKTTLLTSSNLKSSLAGDLTLVLVGADWCKWCGLMAPVFEESNNTSHKLATHAVLSLGSYFGDQGSLLKQVETDYGIQPIETTPALLVFKKGKVVEQLSVSQTKEQLTALIKKHTEAKDTLMEKSTRKK